MGIFQLFKKCEFKSFKESVESILASGVKIIGVDMYVLFHKFAIDVDTAEILVKDPWYYHEKMYERIKNYLLEFKNLGFDLYLVYDGNVMKYKISEEDRSIKRAAAYLKGDWMGALEIVPQQMYNFNHYISEMNIPYIVAPFEADAQLTYMYKNGLIDCVLTNDSDLIIYGVTKIIYIKPKGLEWYEHKKAEEVDCINQMDLEKLWLFGYLIGCDYFKGIPQVGIVKAFKIINELKLVYDNTQVDWDNTIKLLETIPDYYKVIKKISGVTTVETLRSLADKVRMIYTTQAIIDPRTYELKYLTNIKIPENDKDIFGKVYDTEKVGKGIINPNTGEEYQLKVN